MTIAISKNIDLNDSVILNLFQDKMMARTVILKQVQHDEYFVEVAE